MMHRDWVGGWTGVDFFVGDDDLWMMMSAGFRARRKQHTYLCRQILTQEISTQADTDPGDSNIHRKILIQEISTYIGSTDSGNSNIHTYIHT